MCLALALAVACSRDSSKPSAGAVVVPSSSGQVSSRTAAAPAPSGSAPRPAPSAAGSSAALAVHAYDAGTNACRLTYGPVRQAFVGEVALAATDTGILLVTHHDGVPTVTPVSPPDAATASLENGPMFDAGVPVVSSPPCAIAASATFCMDAGGAIHRRPLLTEGRDVVVARARPGSIFAVQGVAAAHAVVAYLVERPTSEGRVSQAYAALDEGPPVALSEEGSGATHVALATRGSSLVALLIDGRTAMTPVHARPLSVSGGMLAAGEDAVVFVGGGAEANTRGALGVSSTGAAFGLVPIAGESGFGLAAVRVDDPPRLDEPTTWSSYLNGLDPAPVAATIGSSPIRVARVRPLEARPDAPRGLELGKLDESGAFVSYGLVGSRGRVRSVSTVVDRAGALWLAFTDGAGTWLERRACP
jgi:hypothetical protein